jgi:hypothetical protein
MINSQFRVAITVAENTFTDVAGNANVAITKNITKISNLTNQVSIDNKGSDVDLTHWDVSVSCWHPQQQLL